MNLESISHQHRHIGAMSIGSVRSVGSRYYVWQRGEGAYERDKRKSWPRGHVLVMRMHCWRRPRVAGNVECSAVVSHLTARRTTTVVLAEVWCASRSLESGERGVRCEVGGVWSGAWRWD